MTEKVHTIRDTEQRLRTLVWGAVAAAAVIDVVLTVIGWPLSALGWVAAAISFALLALCIKRIMRKRTSIGMFPIALFSVGFAGLAGGDFVIAFIGLTAMAIFFIWFFIHWRVYAAAPPVDADAALIVLGCAVHDGRVGGTLEHRLQKAKELLDEEQARICVVTGGPVPDEGVTEAEAMAAWLMDNGIDAGRITLENEALNTEENLTNSWALLNARGHTGQRCIVTSDFHLWRVCSIAKSMELVPEPVPVAAPTPQQGWLVQWCREELVTIDWLRKGTRQS